MRHRFFGMVLVVVCAVLFGAGLASISGCGTAGPTSSESQGASTSDSPTTSPSDTQTPSTLASSVGRVQPSAEAEAQIPTLVTGNTAFALDLFSVVRGAEENSGKNLVFSPHSLSLALAMTYAGTRGETERQMAETLHFTLSQDQLHAAFNALDLQVAASDAEKLVVADSAWVFPMVADRILSDYLDLLARDYGAELYRAPGNVEEARQLINDWTAEKTEGLITDILPPGSLPEEWTALVLGNAMYLKAAWTFAFPEGNTQPAPFYLEDGTTVEVPMMSHDMDYGYAEDSVWAAVDLPCRGDAGEMDRGDISVVFLLPKEGSLDQAVAATTSESLQALIRDMPRDLIAVHLPRFKFDTGMELKEPLESLGMVDAFDPNRADLSGAYGAAEGSEGNGPSGIWVDNVYHGGLIAVDEAGIEAAAASMVVQVAGIGPGEITFDRPFLVLIRHVPTGAILFMGQVMNPAEAESQD